MIILLSVTMVVFAAEPEPRTPEDLKQLEKYVEPEIIDGDYSTKLRVTWKAPTAFVDGTDMHPDQIKGYNLFVKKDDEEKKYLGWFNFDYKMNPPLEYDFRVTDAGKYCVSMTTNTFEHGGSNESETSCVDYDDEAPFIPREPAIPLEIKIKILAPSEFEVQIESETMPIDKPGQQP